jgi:hypothetical protein
VDELLVEPICEDWLVNLPNLADLPGTGYDQFDDRGLSTRSLFLSPIAQRHCARVSNCGTPDFGWIFL